MVCRNTSVSLERSWPGQLAHSATPSLECRPNAERMQSLKNVLLANYQDYTFVTHAVYQEGLDTIL